MDRENLANFPDKRRYSLHRLFCGFNKWREYIIGVGLRMGKPSNKIVTNCLKCEKEIFTTEYKVSKGQSKYCSKTCYDIAQTKQVSVNCTQCKIKYTVAPNKTKNKTGNNFCSTGCYLEHKRNQEDKRPINKCKTCNEDYRTDNYNKDNSNFCSRKCQAKWSSLNKTGENSPKFIERVTLNCDWCNEEYKEEKYIIEVINSKNHFCCRECKNQHHNNIVLKDPIFIEARRSKMIEMLNDGTINTTETKPQIAINILLKKMKIDFENEYGIAYYSIDNYLKDHNLFIEVNGGYWHSDNRFFQEICQEAQVRGVRTDKSKNSYLKNNYCKNILYLWEFDINENIELCELLISEFITQKGILNNYHSFNYSTINNSININKDIIIPYMDMSAELFNTFINFEVKEKMSKIDPLKYIIFKCDHCNTESSQLICQYETSEKHFCDKECLEKYYNHGLRFLYNCKECSTEIEVKKHVHEQLLNGDRKNIFCDNNCKGLWQSKNIIGVNNKNFTSVEKSCEHCSEPYLVIPSRAEESKFCSPKCRQSAERERFIVNCSNCNAPKEVVKSKLSQKNHFCSPECSSIFRSNSQREDRNCEICNEEFNCRKSVKKRFCSVGCQNVWQSKVLVGENGNNYKGNKIKTLQEV